MISQWDLLYVVCVTLLGTTAAYVRDPQIKALTATIPIPFALAWLATGAPVGAGHAAACLLVVVFPNAVRFLHDRLQVPIFVAIPMGWVAYLAPAFFLVNSLPNTPAYFWGLSLLSFGVGCVLFALRRRGGGQLHRTPLPVWAKVPLVLSLVLAMVLLKKELGGFMTLFPVMNTLTSYEGRHSLSIQCRQITAFLIAGPWMLGAMWSVQKVLGVAGEADLAAGIARVWVLLAGLGVYALVFVPLNEKLRRETAGTGAALVS